MSGSPKNIKLLVGALRDLHGRVLLSNERLFLESRQVFEKLQSLKLAKTSDLDPSHIEKTIKILEALPDEITEIDIEELGKESRELESKALNEKELDQLLDDYKKSESENEKGKIEEKIKKSGNRENVDIFIETQKEIAKENQKTEARDKIIDSRGETKKTVRELVEDYKKAGLEKRNEIEKEIFFKTGEKNAEKYIQKSEATVSRNVEELKNFNLDLKERVVQDLIKVSENQPEAVVKIIEKASLKEEFDKRKLKGEIKKNVKDPEKAERIIQKIEEIRAEIKTENKAEEIAQNAFEKLIKEDVPTNQIVQREIKEAILESWKEGDGVKIPDQLTGKGHGEIIAKEVVVAAEKFKNENLDTVVNYRAGELGKNLATELRRNGINDENLIDDFVDVTNKLTNNYETAREEVNRSEVADFIQSKNENIGAGEIERSIDEATFMAKNVVMAPKKFNKLIGKYNLIREKVGADKLPKLKEVRVLEKMSGIFKNSPRMLRLMNGAQRAVGFLEKVNAFPGTLLAKLGVQDVGLKVLGKIGGQAAVEFVKQASLVIAKEGTLQGIKSITLGIVGKGAVAAGGGATTGALASAVAAFQALPVVGQIVLVVVAAVVLLKSVIDGVKGVVGKITGMDMNGVKKFITNTLGLGKLAGGVGQFVVDAGTFLVGIPALIATMAIGAIVTPVVIFFFLGAFVYTMFQHNLVSSIVPPRDTGGGGAEITPLPWPSGAPVPEGCPNRMPSAGYFTQGPFAQGCSHQNMSVPAVDIGAGNGTPIVATHPGIAVQGYDNIYGYYIDVHGSCEGRPFYTKYAHMPAGGYKVANNATVAAGQQIGVIDDTGSSTGPHLHYHIVGLDSNRFGQYLGLSQEQTQQLWGCCGIEWNGKACP
jgi:hypothetical protein